MPEWLVVLLLLAAPMMLIVQLWSIARARRIARDRLLFEQRRAGGRGIGLRSEPGSGGTAVPDEAALDRLARQRHRRRSGLFRGWPEVFLCADVRRDRRALGP